ncbi:MULTISPECIES: branched-chain amino acid ABC transporter permease [unclassified Microbacterium]|uniref:branched-chain amino acid ABC transporter permease n=1 Tax=unclassified Microbacterium TaxID=2609290 RepID=UPI00364899AB
MIPLLQAVVFGVLAGGVYALVSAGLTLTFGVMRIVNLAHATFLILSAYLCYTLWSRFGIDPLLVGAIITIPMALLGLVVYRLIIARVQRIDHNLGIIATFAVAIFLEAFVELFWGPNQTTATPSYFNQSLHLGPITIPLAQLYAFLLAAAVIVAFQLLLRRTALGHAITASSENPEGARLIGIEPNRIGAAVFALASASTALGGAALSFLYQFTPDSQDDWIGLTLCVVIVGGLGNVAAVAASGVFLGLAESLTATYVSVRWAAAVPMVLILLVLLVRPRGLFTRAVRTDVGS